MRWLKLLLISVYMLLSTPVIAAQDSITIILSSGAGGATHRYALKLAPILSKELSMPVNIKISAGAEGNIATNELISCNLKVQHCIMLSSVKPYSALLVDSAFNLTKDIKPVAYAGSLLQAIFVRNTSQYTSFDSILQSKDVVPYGIALQNPIRGFARDYFATLGKDKVIEVTYKSGSGVIQDVLSNTTSFGISPTEVTNELEKNGLIKILAVIGDKKSNLTSAPAVILNRSATDLMYVNYFFWVNNYEDADFIKNLQKSINDFLNSNSSTELKNSMDMHILVKQTQYSLFLNRILNFK